jgi:hypothetical protein
MKEKINIADILKDKPVGLKFYSNTFGYISFNGVHKDKVYFFSEDTNVHSVKPNGKMYDGGECIIFPSKEMRDWEKFSWKKGDVLVTEDGSTKAIFECFEDDTYLTFKGKYCLQKTNIDETFMVDTKKNLTECFSLQAKNIAQIYIHNIEDRMGGILNMETLEIEKAQPKFKDGDIITFKDRIIIYNTSIEKSPKRTEIYYHACLKEGKLTVNEYLMSCGFGEGWYSSTEEEKQQLFEALAKKGKAWDAEKKQIVDIKKELQFKPFEKVLVRDSYNDMWRVSFFSHIKEDDGRYVTTCCTWKFCIPYIGNESLVGTTKDVEG